MNSTTNAASMFRPAVQDVALFDFDNEWDDVPTVVERTPTMRELREEWTARLRATEASL